MERLIWTNGLEEDGNEDEVQAATPSSQDQSSNVTDNVIQKGRANVRIDEVEV